MHVHRMGSTQLVRVGLRDRRGRPDWECPFGYAKRDNSQIVAQVFSSAHDCVSFAVSGTSDFRKVRVMKRRL